MEQNGGSYISLVGNRTSNLYILHILVFPTHISPLVFLTTIWRGKEVTTVRWLIFEFY